VSGSTRDGSIRVVVCDDVAELRALVRLALDDASGIEVVGELDNGQDAIRLIPDLQPDVVLVDLSMPGLDGLEAIPLIAQRAPRTGIVVFSGFAADRMREPALTRGADRYVEKGEPLEVLVAAVREVAAERRRDGGR
jgi:DNA-binding NarL/FixJ family response regulator